MPWKETSVLEQRRAFIEDVLAGRGSVRALCEKHGISEKTGRKWKRRFMESGLAGLADEGRAPHSSPAKLDEDAVIRVLGIRRAHPAWGPRKIAALYARAYPGRPAPSESGIYRVLGKAGLVAPRRVRAAPCGSAGSMRRLIPAESPNDVWTAGSKGWWVSDGERCLPLTVRDLASRAILEVRLMESASAEAVRERFEGLFSRFGLPRVIRSDNGAPFATTTGFLGLTTLSAWWMSLGIVPDRTQPGRPGQNGSHERMHADLSREVQGRVPGGVAANQAALDAWAEEYNRERPREALGMATPSEACSPSGRAYDPAADSEHPMGCLPGKVNKAGEVKLGGRPRRLGSALRGLTVGVQPDEGGATVWLGGFPIASLDFSTEGVRPVDILTGEEA